MRFVGLILGTYQSKSSWHWTLETFVLYNNDLAREGNWGVVVTDSLIARQYNQLVCSNIDLSLFNSRTDLHIFSFRLAKGDAYWRVHKSM